jgi:hypothetical protein
VVAALLAGLAAGLRTPVFAGAFCVTMLTPLENNINNIYICICLRNLKMRYNADFKALSWFFGVLKAM